MKQFINLIIPYNQTRTNNRLKITSNLLLQMEDEGLDN